MLFFEIVQRVGDYDGFGAPDRHPIVDIVTVHGGGYLPTYLGRSDQAWNERPDAHSCAEPPSTYMRRLWFASLAVMVGMDAGEHVRSSLIWFRWSLVA